VCPSSRSSTSSSSRAGDGAGTGAHGPSRSLSTLDIDLLHDRLRAVHGPQPGWWPARSDLEMMIGAVLVQNTRWQNVAMSIANLERAGLLDAEAVLAADPEDLTRLIRPSGFMTAKTAAVRGLASWFLDRDRAARSLPDEDLRAELLALRGIGPETADVISLYTYGRRLFVVDAYARRLLAADGFGLPRSYEAARRALAPALDRSTLDADGLGQVHGLIVEEGKARAVTTSRRP
jgi:endonuclease-3 related protein